AQRTVEELLDGVRDRAGNLRVLGAYVQNAEPSLPVVLAEAGPGAIVVPLLLSHGYHVAVDIARAVEAADAVAAPPLGPDPTLCAHPAVVRLVLHRYRTTLPTCHRTYSSRHDGLPCRRRRRERGRGPVRGGCPGDAAVARRADAQRRRRRRERRPRGGQAAPD